MLRAGYDLMMDASRAHARWQVDSTRRIMGSRWMLLFLLLLLAPILLVNLVWAGEGLPEILGGHHAFTPAHYTPNIFGIAILTGLGAGLITGCIGAGGGFIITPAMMSAGIKGILAVGTDLFHIFANAIMGTVVHRKLGNVSAGLALSFFGGSLFGVLGGGAINRAIYEIDPLWSDAVISLLYVLLLGFLGFYSLGDFLRQRRKAAAPDSAAGAEALPAQAGPIPKTGISARIQALNIPPYIVFDRDLIPGGKRISALVVAAGGAFVGFFAALMGVGGGFLTFPMYVYVMGVSSLTAVGSDVLQIIFTAGFAAISQYAIYGFIYYSLAVGMLLGSLLGIQIGAMTTRVVRGIYIRGFYAVAILAGFSNRLFALPAKLGELKVLDLDPLLGEILVQVGNVALFLVIGSFALWVFVKLLTNLKNLRDGN